MTADVNWIDWPGKSGATYRYWFLADISPGAIKEQGGNYMFVRLANQAKNQWEPVYIGIAENLRTRLPSHEVWPDAKKIGAIRIMGHTQDAAAAREKEEQDLIAHWNPPLNTQHRTTRKAG